MKKLTLEVQPPSVERIEKLGHYPGIKEPCDVVRYALAWAVHMTSLHQHGYEIRAVNPSDLSDSVRLEVTNATGL